MTSRCKLIAYVVHGHGYERGASYAATRCETHDWEIGTVPVSADYLCPIGRIEEARDNAVAAIKRAQYNDPSNGPS